MSYLLLCDVNCKTDSASQPRKDFIHKNKKPKKCQIHASIFFANENLFLEKKTKQIIICYLCGKFLFSTKSAKFICLHIYVSVHFVINSLCLFL